MDGGGSGMLAHWNLVPSAQGAKEFGRECVCVCVRGGGNDVVAIFPAPSPQAESGTHSLSASRPSDPRTFV